MHEESPAVTCYACYHNIQVSELAALVDPLGGEAENNGTFQVGAGEATVESRLKWRGLAY